MVKNFLAALLTISFYHNVFAQQNYPVGIYKNVSELTEKSPVSPEKLEVVKRSIGEIKMSGGNDYKITSTNKSISKKDIKKNVLAYSNGDTLFINCGIYDTQKWYAAVLTHGKYLMFIGAISEDPDTSEYQIEKSNTPIFHGTLGAIGGAIEGGKIAKLRFPYIIDTEENKAHYLTNNTLRKLLADKDLTLLKQYDLERENLNSNEKLYAEEEILLFLKYIKVLNAEV